MDIDPPPSNTPDAPDKEKMDQVSSEATGLPIYNRG